MLTHFLTFFRRAQRTRSACAVVTLVLSVASVRLHAAETLHLDSNETIFYVMTAINAAGYDEGLNLPDANPLRKQIRDYLATQRITVLPELKLYFRHHMQKTAVQDVSQFLWWSVAVTGAPDFAWKGRDVEVPPAAIALDGFQPLMADFYRQANLAELWKKVQPAYEKELARYHAPILGMTQAVDAYLRVGTNDYPERHYHAIVELMIQPQIVQMLNNADDEYVVISPSEQPKMYDIRHSYLHFQIDPVMIRYGKELQLKQSMLDLVQNTPLDDGYKNNFELLATESLIKAVEGRLDKNINAIDMATRQGYIMTPFFAEQLPGFEKAQQGLRYYADVMINAIDLKAESERISTVKFDGGQLQRLAKKVVVAGPELSPAGKTLEKAEDLYAARAAAPGNLEEAKTLFTKALDQKGEPAERAQAWYGLARITVLDNKASVAIQLFQKTLESSPDDFTRAWANLYLARLAKAQKDLTLAVKYYQDALAVNGASEKAKQAASSELQEISKNQEKQKQ